MPRTRRRAALAVAVVLLAMAPLGTWAAEQPPDDPERQGPQQHDPVALDLHPLTGEQERPNIVLIMADDMRADELRFMPHTRRLIGDRGVRFENSFSPYPLCCPARATLLTGDYTHNHGVWSNREPFGIEAFDDSSALPVLLEEVGYNTGFLGKYLNRYGHGPLPDGSSSETYVPPGWSDWRGATNGTYRYYNTTLNLNGILTPFRGRYQSHVFGGQTEQMIGAFAKSPAPFFLWASYVAPHIGRPHEPDDPEPVLRNDGSTRSFSTPARPGGVRGIFDEVITEAPGADGEADVSGKPSFIRSEPRLNDPERAALLELTRQRAESLYVVDQQVARTVEALRASGELDDTLIAFVSDNGYFLGEHRRRGGKSLAYEPSLRVPLLVRGPGIPAGEVRSDPFSMTDFAPTFLEAAGAQVPPVDGASLFEVARDGDRGWTRPILTESGPRDIGSSLEEVETRSEEIGGPSQLRFSQGIRTARYLYVEHASREQELYDMRTDPGQLSNVVDRDDMADVRSQLARVLDRMRTCEAQTCREPLPPGLRDD